MTIMEEPSVTNCGHTFEKKAIEDWLKKDNKCPVCKVEITSTVPNYTLRAIIQNRGSR